MRAIKAFQVFCRLSTAVYRDSLSSHTNRDIMDYNMYNQEISKDSASLAVYVHEQNYQSLYTYYYHRVFRKIEYISQKILQTSAAITIRFFGNVGQRATPIAYSDREPILSFVARDR